MEKFIAILQLLAAIAMGLMSAATVVNLVLISMRPETISVVNTMIGQGVIIICLAAMSNILFRRAWTRLRAPAGASEEHE